VKVLIFKILVFCLFFEPYYLAAEPEEILILGHRRENKQVSRPGQTLSIKPEESTRFDTNTHLKGQTGIALPETGRVNASGFVIPRIRGQDSRLTEIYFDGVLLQNPLTGLPLIDDLDLRAFGELRVHQGVTPFDLPGVNTIGAMEYRLTTRRSQQVGINVGEPYGHATWALGGQRRENIEWRIYSRLHETRGKYSYYDDHATPYNEDDDEQRWRTNNDRRSKQLLPVVIVHSDKQHVRLMAFLNHGEAAVPAANASQNSYARNDSHAGLVSLSWLTELPDLSATQAISIKTEISRHHDDRRTKDPTRAILGNATSGSFTVESLRAAATPRLDGEFFSTLATFEATRAQVETQSGTDRALKMLRQGQALTVAAAAHPKGVWQALQLETKANWNSWRDELKSQTADDVFASDAGNKSRASLSRGRSLAVGWERSLWHTYAQVAVNDRKASLLEEFGDGGQMRGNPGIKPEMMRHGEIGGGIRPALPWALQLNTALFRDDTKDKISFMPSVSQTLRAQNISQTRVQGISIEMTNGAAQTELTLSWTNLWPEDLSTPQRPTLIPLTPERTGFARLTQKVGPAFLQWSSRYRSRVFRDEQNTISIPAVTIHDFAIDSNWGESPTWNIGASIINVFNITYVNIEAPQTGGSKGKTAYGDLAGSPLPGRQWLINTAINF
jgi:hypothetical protein